MKTALVAKPLSEVETPLLAVLVTRGDFPPSLAELDRASGGAVKRAFASGDFKGKKDDASLLYPAGTKAQRILLLGLGKSGDVTRQSVRRGAAAAARRARCAWASRAAGRRRRR